MEASSCGGESTDWGGGGPELSEATIDALRPVLQPRSPSHEAQPVWWRAEVLMSPLGSIPPNLRGNLLREASRSRTGREAVGTWASPHARGDC